MKSALANQVDAEGYAILPALVDPSLCETLKLELSTLERDHSKAGMRNLLGLSLVRKIADSDPIKAAVRATLGAHAFAYKATLFEKGPEANWLVAWHQDLSLPIKERKSIEGWRAWSIKEGVVHAQPPAAILEQVLAVRIHLDDVTQERGPLRVLPGTHKAGKLNNAQIREFANSIVEVMCTGQTGSVVLMRPLLLHASSKATRPLPRRVLHLEFSANVLPQGMQFAVAT